MAKHKNSIKFLSQKSEKNPKKPFRNSKYLFFVLQVCITMICYYLFLVVKLNNLFIKNIN